jgi:uncharacterized membrane protein
VTPAGELPDFELQPLVPCPDDMQMALHPEQYPMVPGGGRSLWGRLPLQGVLVAWVLDAARG